MRRSVIDFFEDLPALSMRVDIVFWPVAMDGRRKDLEILGDGEIDLSLINGAIRTHEQAHMARLLRRKSKRVLAHGACAHLGGIVGLGNFHTVQALLTRSFVEVPTVKKPGGHSAGGTGGGFRKEAGTFRSFGQGHDA